MQPPQKQSPLLANRAFVVQFRAEADVQQGRFDGRVEHVVSGQTALFHSLEELTQFLAKALSPTPRRQRDT
jgi:hypothetical protein